jgi:ATP-dependent RNA helicase SrmB
MAALKRSKIDAAVCHADKSQGARRRAIADFKSAKLQVLIATEVAARGLDIQGLDYVVNYNLPYLPEDYVHRIGRTGRAGNKGTAISIVDAHDIGVVPKIERYTEQVLKRRVIAALRPSNKEAKPPAKKKISNKTKKAVIKAKRITKIKKRKNKGRGKKTP